MPNLRPVLFIFGLLLLLLSAAMLIPAMVEWSYGHGDADDYFAAASVPLLLGGMLVFSQRERRVELRPRQAYILTVLAWVAAPAFAALPFMLTDLAMPPVDAYFEAVSGLTTTGSTVIADLAQVRPGALIWRSILQWLGGIGIIVMAIAILPFLRVGGMQLLRTESSDRADKVLPRPGQFAASIGAVYLGLTILAALAYRTSGMTWFQAANHAMTTLSTGGFSTENRSLGGFGPAAQWWASLFMLAGALPFGLYVRALHGDRWTLLRNSQVRSLLYLVIVAGGVLAAWAAANRGLGWSEALRHGLFTTISIVTTTGFASTDYQLWGPFAMGVALLLTLAGGCTGSTAGGIKVFRWQILVLQAKTTLRQTSQPNRVVPRLYEGRRVSGDVFGSVSTFFFLFFALTAVLTLGLLLFHLDPMTALSGAVTALANVGPGLGDLIGPSGTFVALPVGAKLLLSAGMLLGRLELLTILVLLDPSFWRG